MNCFIVQGFDRRVLARTLSKLNSPFFLVTKVILMFLFSNKLLFIFLGTIILHLLIYKKYQQTSTWVWVCE